MLGLDVITDCKAFEDALESPVFKAGGERAMGMLEKLFPGILAAVLEGNRELEVKRIRPTTLVYFNYRVQVWGLGVDADPSQIIRVLPAGLPSVQLSVH